MMRVTSKDVARAAGVSQATVSYVLNGRTDQGISDHTRQAVLAAARELGYVRSAAARALRTGRSEVVLCLVADFTVSQATEEFKVVLSQVLADAGYSCVYLHHAGTHRPLEDLWQQVHPAAVIAFGELSDPDAEAIRRAGIALLDAVFGADSGALTGIDQREVGRMQVRYLAGKGHRHLGFAAVADPREARFCQPRLRGAQQACAELGLPDPIVAVLDDPPTPPNLPVPPSRDGVSSVPLPSPRSTTSPRSPSSTPADPRTLRSLATWHSSASTISSSPRSSLHV